MLKHEISASWFSNDKDHRTSSGRLLAVIQEDGPASFLIEGATGQIAHVSVRSVSCAEDPSLGISECARMAPPKNHSTPPVTLLNQAPTPYGPVLLHAAVGSGTAVLLLLVIRGFWPEIL